MARGGRVGVAVLVEKVGSEVGARLYDRITRFAEPVGVAGVIVVFPYLRREPGTGARIVVPCHVARVERSGEPEYVCGYAGCPSAGVPVVAGRVFTRFDKAADIVYIWHEAFEQVGRCCRPVVHLHVDVVVVIHAPRSVEIVVPDSLQVGRHTAGTRR